MTQDGRQVLEEVRRIQEEVRLHKERRNQTAYNASVTLQALVAATEANADAIAAAKWARSLYEDAKAELKALKKSNKHRRAEAELESDFDAKKPKCF